MKLYGIGKYVRIVIGVLLITAIVAFPIVIINAKIAGDGGLGDLYFTDAERIIGKGDTIKVVQFGASTAQSGINREKHKEVEVMASSAQSMEEMLLLIDYLEAKGYTYTKDNYLLLDMGTSTIRNVEYHNMAAVANINTWGDFYVTQNLELTRKSYVTSAIKRYLFPIEQNCKHLWESMTSKLKAGAKMEAAEAVEQNYQELYQAQLEEWNDFTKDFTYLTEEQKESFKQRLMELNERSNVIVNFVYITQAHADANEGHVFNAYIDNELMPFLEEHGIAYIDSRYEFGWEDYGDRAHLTEMGQEKYTDFIMQEIYQIMGKQGE